jgi:hypothetical protein
MAQSILDGVQIKPPVQAAKAFVYVIGENFQSSLTDRDRKIQELSGNTTWHMIS